MLAKPADAPFDSDEHVFEPSWGGRRVLAFIEAANSDGRPRLRLLDESGHDLAPRLPELWSIADRVNDLPAILDGEVVVPDRAGRMDEASLEARLTEGLTVGLTPVYVVFDLPWAGGRPIIAEPLRRRRERLARVVTPGPELVVLPGLVGEGLDLYYAVAQQGLRAVMARHLRSPYLPGRRSEMWRRIPTRPGEIALHVLPDPAPEPGRPVLALIQRLPLED